MTVGGGMTEQSETPSARPARDEDAHAGERPWWNMDTERHAADHPNFCPGCAYPIGDDLRSLAIEYWEADRPVYQLRCASCGWVGAISPVDRAASRQSDD